MTGKNGNPEGPLIYLVAGEPSGDVLGGRLMAALRRLSGGTMRFAGIGGPHMAEEGLASLFPMAELSIMGLTEVLPHIPRLLGRIRQTVTDVATRRPAALVTIDSPGFTFRVARRLKGTGIPLIHFVAPTVWAWRPGRAREIARFLDHLMVMLPFEPPYFEAVGLSCTFVGHPVVESGAGKGDGDAFRKRHGIAADTPVICVLPGSRRGETARLMPVFADTLALLAKRQPGLTAVVPTVATVAADVTAAAAGWPVPAVVVEGDVEKYDAFAAAAAALAASGTVALELAMAGTPTVIAYRVNPLTAWLAKRLIRIRFANLVNLVMDREVVPELLQENCRPDRLAAAATHLMDDTAARETQVAAAGEAMSRLGLGGPSPSERAALAVLDVIGTEHSTLPEGEQHD